MPTYHLSQSDLISLFQSRARIATEAAIRAPTERGRAILYSEASTWTAAAQILSQTLLTIPPEAR